MSLLWASVRGLARASDGAAFALVAGSVVFAGVLWLPVVLLDTDTLWHITTGDWILAHRAVPVVDTFSFTAAGRPWAAHEWLSEVVLALAYRATGWNGLLILTAAAAGLTTAVVALQVRRLTRLDVAIMLVLLMLACSGPSLLARPHLLALPLLAIWTAALASARARGEAPSLGVLPLMTLWANLHGGFLIGLALAGALAVEAAFDPACRRNEQLRCWGLFIAGAVIAAIVTPQGIDGLLFPFRLLAMKNLHHIDEWQPSDLGHVSGVTVSLLVALYLGLTGKLKLPAFRVLLVAGLLFMTMQHVRYGQLFGVMAPLLIVMAMGPAQPVLRQEWIFSRVASLAALLSLGVRAGLPFERGDDIGYAATAIASVPPNLRTRPVLNEYAFGGMLIFSGIRPFIDGRADLYGDAGIERYLSVTGAQAGVLDDVLREYGIAWTIFRPDTVVPALLDRTPGWHRSYSDKVAVIHVRDGETPTLQHNAGSPACTGIRQGLSMDDHPGGPGG